MPLRERVFHVSFSVHDFFVSTASALLKTKVVVMRVVLGDLFICLLTTILQQVL